MTYKETKEYGANCIIYTTYHGFGDYYVNDQEINDTTGNEFFTKEEAEARIKTLASKGYIIASGYDEEIDDVYTYELWDDTEEYIDNLIKEEKQGIYN